MSYKLHKDLGQIVHPYMFVLKEGPDFKADYLDYSLMMLHVNCLEVFPSPRFDPVVATVSKAAIANLAHTPEQGPEVSQILHSFSSASTQ